MAKKKAVRRAVVSAVDNDQRKFLFTAFFWFSIGGAVLLVILVAVSTLVLLMWTDPTAKILSAKLAFTCIGLLFAIFQLITGVLLALIGITTDYDIDASIGAGSLKLAAASPGIMLIITANLLFGFSLMRTFKYESTVTAEPVPVASKTAVEKIQGAQGKGPE